MADRLELIDFWATGWAPSVRCHWAVRELAHDPRLDIRVHSFDAWDAPMQVADFQIITLPTVLLLVDGVERARCFPHSVTADELADWLSTTLERIGLSPAARPATPVS